MVPKKRCREFERPGLDHGDAYTTTCPPSFKSSKSATRSVPQRLDKKKKEKQLPILDSPNKESSAQALRLLIKEIHTCKLPKRQRPAQDQST
ncbi:hypothetical protein NC652_034815 [Populus alba x Populus x berolinensis]|nr:hypothetical protein NC652_034815 [Populus alba x Populus x berolinensis]